MALAVFPALILKTHETGNTSEVVHVLSAEHGRLSVFARGLRRPKSRFAAAMQPLTFAELSVSMAEHADTATLREAAVLRDHGSIVTDLERFALAMLLAEAASASCQPAQPAPEILAAVLQGLAAIAPESGQPPIAATIGAIAHVLDAAGYQPQIDDALLRPWPGRRPEAFWLDVTTGLIHADGVQPSGTPQWPVDVPRDARHFLLPPAAVRFLYDLEQGRQPTIGRATGAQLLEGLVRLTEHHQETALRAAEFWRSVFRP